MKTLRSALTGKLIVQRSNVFALRWQQNFHDVNRRYNSSGIAVHRWGSHLRMRRPIPYHQSVNHCGIMTYRTIVSQTQASQLNLKDKSRRQPENKTSRSNIIFQRLSLANEQFNSAYNRLAQTSYGRLMRLDKPIGYKLLFLPGAWGITIGSTSPLEFLTLTGLFYGGAILMRGAGCTINDIWDADIDKSVQRTKSRPIASGEISVPTAFVFLGTQLSGALWILTQLNTPTFLVASISVLPVFFYPFAKRNTAYPQSALGLTFNSGALMGYTAATGTIALPAVLLYGAGWCWTMVYDTIYAHQDKKDDEKIGVYSTALTFGENTKPILAAFTAAKLTCLTGAGLAAGLSLPYFMGITASTIHLGHQIYSTDLSNPAECQEAFVSNQITGAITWASILAGRLI